MGSWGWAWAFGFKHPGVQVWPKFESRATLCKQDTSLQQADSLPRIQNRQTVKIWTGTVCRVLKSPGVQLLMCPMLTLLPRLYGRASAGPSPAAEEAVGMKLRSAALPPSPTRTKC